MSPAKPRQALGRSPDVLRRALLGLAVLLLALGAFEAMAAARSLWELRQARFHGQPPARTAREDYATNPDWLDVWWKLDATVAGAFFTSGGGLLWVRGRARG